MARMEENLRQLCRESPDRPRRVVITVGDDFRHLRPGALGLAGAEPIAGLSGMFSGALRGGRLLELAERPEIEAIEADVEVSIDFGAGG